MPRDGHVAVCVVLAAFALAQRPVAGSDAAQVSTSGDLITALEDAAAGDVIELMDGTYATTRILRLKATGTDEQPVVIRAAQPGQAAIAGRFGLLIEKSAHVRVEGLTFTHSNHSRSIEVKHSSQVVIRDCTFRLNEDEDQSTHWVYVTGTSSHVTLQRCLFDQKHKPGCFITLDGTDDAGRPAQIVQHCRIDGCTFRNVGPRIKNGMEAIRLGDSQMSMSDAHCRLTGNTFENCDGDPEVVSVKCCAAVIDGNTFRNCQGGLCLRHGNRSTVARNVFIGIDGKPGVGGIRIYGCDHDVTENALTGLTGKGDEGPLVLCNGETDTGPLNARFRPQRVRIAHNSLTDCVHSSIDIGYDDGGRLTLPSRDCRIEDNRVTSNSGTLVNVINPSPTLRWEGNMFIARGSAKVGVEVRDGRAIVVP